MILSQQIHNRVVFICRDDESAWRPSGTHGEAIGSYITSIDPITKKLRCERSHDNCLNSFSHRNEGRLIEVSSEGRGVIAIETLIPPESTLAVVRLVTSNHEIDVHLVEGVNVEDLRAYNWSLEGKERFQLYRCPEPPPQWRSTPEEWRSSPTYQAHQQHFAQKLEEEFASAIQALSIHIRADAQKAFDTFITTACRDNPGWFWDIRKAAAVYALTGTFSKDALTRMVYLVQEVIDPESLPFKLTPQQTIKALFDHCKHAAGTLSDAEIWETQTRCDLLSTHELMRIVQIKAKHKPFFYRWLWRMNGKPDPVLIENPDLYELFREEIIGDRDRVMAAFGINGALEVDYRDQVINSMMRDDGWILEETDRFEEEEQRRNRNIN